MAARNSRLSIWARKLSLLAFLGLAGLPSIGLPAIFDHEFGVNGKAVLCVPQRDMDPYVIPYNDESTDLAVGSGRTPGFGFLFDAEEIDKHLRSGSFRTFPEFNELHHVNKLSGSVGFLSTPDSRRLGSGMRARNLKDEWYASGSCSQAVTRQLPQSDLFEVKCTSKDDYANILNRLPDRNQPMPEHHSIVAATCVFETISAGKFAGLSLRNCNRVVILDGFLVDYRIQEDNLPLYRQLDDFLRGKIADWKERCASGRKV